VRSGATGRGAPLVDRTTDPMGAWWERGSSHGAVPTVSSHRDVVAAAGSMSSAREESSVNKSSELKTTDRLGHCEEFVAARHWPRD
jgi:hypothetical protein